MFQTLISWLTPPRATRPNPRRFAPQVEALQDRLTPTVSVVNGNLNIVGTNVSDTVTVSRVGSVYRVTEYVPNAYDRSLPGTTTVTDVPAASVTGQLIFQGNNSNDRFATTPPCGAPLTAGTATTP